MQVFLAGWYLLLPWAAVYRRRPASANFLNQLIKLLLGAREERKGTGLSLLHTHSHLCMVTLYDF